MNPSSRWPLGEMARCHPASSAHLLSAAYRPQMRCGVIPMIVQHASYRQVWIANDAGSARIPASSATSAMTHLLCCECDLLLCGCMLPVAATGLHFLACCPAVACCLLLVGRLIQLCLGFVPGAAALGCAWLGYNHCCYSWPQAVLASCRHTPQPCSIWSSQSL